jgi:hypothetical protein
VSVTQADRPRRLISLQLYEDQLRALDERAAAAERSRSAEIRLIVDASLRDRSAEEAQQTPAKNQEGERRAL